jgi:hypothetical protein
MRTAMRCVRGPLGAGLVAWLALASAAKLDAQEIVGEPPPPSPEELAERRVVFVTGSTSASAASSRARSVSVART